MKGKIRSEMWDGLWVGITLGEQHYSQIFLPLLPPKIRQKQKIELLGRKQASLRLLPRHYLEKRPSVLLSPASSRIWSPLQLPVVRPVPSRSSPLIGNRIDEKKLGSEPLWAEGSWQSPWVWPANVLRSGRWLAEQMSSEKRIQWSCQHIHKIPESCSSVWLGYSLLAKCETGRLCSGKRPNTERYKSFSK